MNMLSGMDVLATESVTGLHLTFIYDSFQRDTKHSRAALSNRTFSDYGMY